MTEKILCGLDLGSKQVKACMTRFDKKRGALELLGVHVAPTRGLDGGSVTDLTELSGCLFDTLEGVYQKVGKKVKEIHLGIGGSLIHARMCGTIFPLLDRGSKVITPGDIRRINKQASSLGIKMEEQIIHSFPQQYTIDESTIALNPIGLHGRKVEAQLLLLMANINLVANITKAVHQAGFEFSKVSFSSLAASEICLTKQNKNNGVVLIDIGATTTNILIFKDGILRGMDILHLGGNQVTDSIAKGIDVSRDLAEEIKKSYGDVETDGDSKKDEILIKRDMAYSPVKKENIYQAIEPEITRLGNCLEQMVKKSPFYDRINDGIVVVGGGCLLSGLIERIEKLFNFPVKLAKIQVETIHFNKPATFSSTMGLTQQALLPPYDSFLKSTEKTGRFRKFVNLAKDLYEEYF